MTFQSSLSTCGNSTVFGRSYKGGTVAEANQAIPEVHGLLGHYVDTDPLLLVLALQVVFPGDVTQDGV